jgi:hypothetical protein
MLGCSVFVGRVIILPESTNTNERHLFDESAEISILEIGKEVAEDNGLSIVSEPYTRLSGEDYATLLIFQRKGKIWLSLLIKDDRSEMTFLITDQGHGEETPMTAMIGRGLMHQVRQRLPDAEIRYEKTSQRGSLMAP